MTDRQHSPKEKAPVSLLNLPLREDPVEICKVCGTEFRGLYHCQSLKHVKDINDDTFMKKEDR